LSDIARASEWRYDQSFPHGTHSAGHPAIDSGKMR
jgi:hypothetical protein